LGNSTGCYISCERYVFGLWRCTLLASKNTYYGTIENIQLKVNDTYYPAPAWLTEASTQVSGKADMVSAAANMPQTLQPLIDGGAGDFTLAQLEGGGYISSIQRAGIEGGLVQLIGLSQEQVNAMNLNMITWNL
jgi:long-chain fatty acid transport protein